MRIMGTWGKFVFLALLLISIVCVSSVSAHEKVIIANESQLRTIDELWGKDITIGEYLEKVHPDVLAEMPEKIRVEMYDHTMPWGKPTVESDQSELRDYFIDVQAMISPTSSYIDFGGTATTTDSVPYLYVEAYLRNDAQQTIGSTSYHVYSGSTVSAYNMVYQPASDYYYTYAWGYSSSPYHEGSDQTQYAYFPA